MLDESMPVSRIVDKFNNMKKQYGTAKKALNSMVCKAEQSMVGRQA